jgi:hypothetical protein
MTIEEILSKVRVYSPDDYSYEEAKTALLAYFKGMLPEEKTCELGMENGWNAYRAEMLRRIKEEGK